MDYGHEDDFSSIFSHQGLGLPGTHAALEYYLIQGPGPARDPDYLPEMPECLVYVYHDAALGSKQCFFEAGGICRPEKNGTVMQDKFSAESPAYIHLNYIRSCKYGSFDGCH